ncbi:hypothetical protein CD152_10600 [Macrococcoides caseolyticum]|nr:hypothetical protein CD152_10600 [Macrococcus caseolyticus]
MQGQLVERSDPLQSSVSRTSALADSDTVLLDCRMINLHNSKHASVCSLHCKPTEAPWALSAYFNNLPYNSSLPYQYLSVLIYEMSQMLLLCNDNIYHHNHNHQKMVPCKLVTNY